VNIKNKDEMEQNPDLIRINSILNPDDGKLPFGYYAHDSGCKITWNCGTDQENRMISVFCYDNNGNKDKKISVLPTMEEANYIKNELIKAGWLKIIPPEITVTYEDGSKKNLTRKQKRYLKKTLNKMEKENPFDGQS